MSDIKPKKVSIRKPRAKKVPKTFEEQKNERIALLNTEITKMKDIQLQWEQAIILLQNLPDPLEAIKPNLDDITEEIAEMDEHLKEVQQMTESDLEVISEN